MKIVLDTHVLVSGLLSPKGIGARILRLTFGGALGLCVDERILDEYASVLPGRLFGLDPDDVTDVLNVIRTQAERVTPLPLAANLPHEADRPFLEVAAAARTVLVTGNARHFPKRTCKGIAVVTPDQFLDLLRQHPPE